MFQGILRIKPLSAKLTHETGSFGRMDPYVKIKIGDKFQKTLADRGGHLEPSWDDELVFELDGSTNEVQIQVKNETIIFDDYIGIAIVNLSDWPHGETSSSIQNIPLTFKGRSAGNLLLEVSFEPKPGQQIGEKVLGTERSQIDENILGKERTQAGEKILGKERSQADEKVLGTEGSQTDQFLSTASSLSQTLQNLPRILQQETTASGINRNLDTVVIKHEPIIVKERPIVIENEIIKEQPIITDKETIYITQPVIVEKHELHERVVHETGESKVITMEPVYKTEAPQILDHKPVFEEPPKVEKHTEVIHETPIAKKEQPEVFMKEVITEKPVIHEKEIIERENPIFVEKPIFIRKEFTLPTEQQVVREQTVMHPEMEAYTNKLPEDLSGNVHHEKPELIQANPEIIREKPDVFEKNVMIEQPIIHEQPIIRTEKEVVVEKPEIFQTRITHQEQTKVIKELQPDLRNPQESVLP